MKILSLASLFLLAGCPETTTTPADMLAACEPDLAFVSLCGVPCQEESNKLGVGKFCYEGKDCKAPAGNADWKATICSTLLTQMDPNTTLKVNFCTKLCNNPSIGSTDLGMLETECGPNSECQCLNGSNGMLIGCGCTPKSCGSLSMIDMKQ